MQENTAVFYQQTFLPALQRLDARLEEAFQTAQLFSGSNGKDRFRGLYLNQDDISQLFSTPPGQPHLWDSTDTSSSSQIESLVFHPGYPLTWLKDTYQLTSFDCDVLLLALAPEIDRRYEKIYAFLQDHVARKRPSVDLALNLFSTNAVVRLDYRQRFAPTAPLRQHGLLHLIPEEDHPLPSLLSHTLKADPQVVQFLIGASQLDERLIYYAKFSAFTTREKPLYLEQAVANRILNLAKHAQNNLERCIFHFHGLIGTGKGETVAWLASQLQIPVLALNLHRLRNSQADWREHLRIALRQQHFQRCLLFLSPIDVVMKPEFSLYIHDLLELVSATKGILVLGGQRPFLPQSRKQLNIIPVHFDFPDTQTRHAIWKSTLTEADLPIQQTTITELASRFRLTATQIETAVSTAKIQHIWQQAADTDNPPPNTIAPSQLFAAARSQCGHDLASLAQKISPVYTWTDIILPEETKTQLYEICRRVACRHQVLREWGFDAKLSLGTGTNALFSGPSGTGKTMAAEIIANELELDLYKIDLSGVISKYIGETEKNLDRIFKAAENANAILFFDEADALFGKRSEVRDSHDRYANIEISYLLQKMEEYSGLTILATNLRQNLDEAFVRRLAFMVHFPFPDETNRYHIWQGIWPKQTPLHEDTDLKLVAKQFKLSGGNIKNIALAAAYLAADNDEAIGMAHLYQAARREYQKMGKTINIADFEIARE